jgi:Flp pilus assembly protein TadD
MVKMSEKTQRMLHRMLAVRPGDATITIKRAFRRAAANQHPDKHWSEDPEKQQEVHEQFLKIKQAYDVLKDRDSRKDYFEQLQKEEDKLEQRQVEARDCYRSGAEAFKAGRYEEALRDAKKAIRMGGGQVPHRVLLCHCLLKLDQQKEAGDTVRLLMLNNPDEPGVRTASGVYFMERGWYLKAEREFEKALKARPADTIARENLDMIRQLGIQQEKPGPLRALFELFLGLFSRSQEV